MESWSNSTFQRAQKIEAPSDRENSEPRGRAFETTGRPHIFPASFTALSIASFVLAARVAFERLAQAALREGRRENPEIAVTSP